MLVYFVGVVTEQLAEGLAHDPGDVIAVAVEVSPVGQSAECLHKLKLRHAMRHDGHAPFDSAALNRTQVVGHADDTAGVRDQISFARQRRGRQERMQLSRERLRLFVAGHNVDKAPKELLLMRR